MYAGRVPNVLLPYLREKVRGGGALAVPVVLFEMCIRDSNETLWVMWPNATQINTAKSLIQQVLNGETPTLPQD